MISLAAESTNIFIGFTFINNVFLLLGIKLNRVVVLVNIFCNKVRFMTLKKYKKKRKRVYEKKKSRNEKGGFLRPLRALIPSRASLFTSCEMILVQSLLTILSKHPSWYFIQRPYLWLLAICGSSMVGFQPGVHLNNPFNPGAYRSLPLSSPLQRPRYATASLRRM